jgi:hypothetical protein
MESDCQFCGGSGQCANCGGNGSYRENGNYYECIKCYEDGKCAECRGTGKRRLLHELRNSYWSLGYYERRFVETGVALVVVLSLAFWRVMLPFFGIVAAVALYLRWSRQKDSL